MTSCEKCWRDAKGNPDRYAELIESRTGTADECSPEEIAGGEDAGECRHCQRQTVHCVVGRCMNPRCARYEMGDDE